MQGFHPTRALSTVKILLGPPYYLGSRSEITQKERTAKLQEERMGATSSIVAPVEGQVDLDRGKTK